MERRTTPQSAALTAKVNRPEGTREGGLGRPLTRGAKELCVYSGRKHKLRKMRFVRARVLVLAFGLGILLCLIWVRSMDKPEGGVVPVVSVTYEAVEHGP